MEAPLTIKPTLCPEQIVVSMLAIILAEDTTVTLTVSIVTQKPFVLTVYKILESVIARGNGQFVQDSEEVPEGEFQVYAVSPNANKFRLSPVQIVVSFETVSIG